MERSPTSQLSTALAHEKLVSEELIIAQSKDKNVRDVHTTRLQRCIIFGSNREVFHEVTVGNKYLMVMVEINSNAILINILKSRKDTE